MRKCTLVVGLLWCVAGCGQGVVPVSGRVTLDDKPLANATVIFQPDSKEENPGPGSQGKTDEQGRYTLSLLTQDVRGAIVGRHKISITAYEGNGANAPPGAEPEFFKKPLVPPEYNVASQLTFDVPPKGTTAADFHLKTAK